VDPVPSDIEGTGVLGGTRLWWSNQARAAALAGLLTLVLAGAVAVGFWQVHQSRVRGLESESAMVAGLAAKHLEAWMEGRFALVGVIADRWTEQYQGRPAAFRRDAMPGGGVVRVATRAERLREGAPGTLPELPPGLYAVLTVSDHGIGIDPETAGRVFEPFFTTKDVGAGTGLGLATVYGAAEQNGGAVRIESEPGKGTRLHVYLRTVPT
jgi:hypothetical protein